MKSVFKSKLILMLFVCVYLLTLLFTFPASLLDKAVQYASQDRLLLANVTGTLWEGTATLGLRSLDGRLVALPHLYWKVTVQSLLKGKVRVLLQWDEQSPEMATEAIISLGKIELHHAHLQLPARLMGEVSSLLKPAQFRGQLQIQSDLLVLSKAGIEGNAVIDWHQAGSALSSISPLGEYRLSLEGKNDRLHIGLATISGILFMEGEGDLLAGRGLEFHGKAHASSEAHDNLTELLHHLGPEISPGVHAFNLVNI